jgi:excisionase family DNA binding protein
MLTLAQAAKETGLTKPAIFKAIKKGKISASKDARGQWLIDPAELFRVYAPVSMKETVEPPTGNVELRLKLAELEAKFELTEKRLLEKDHELEDVRAQREHWRIQAEAVTHLLTAGGEPPQKPSWWRRLWGKS